MKTSVVFLVLSNLVTTQALQCCVGDDIIPGRRATKSEKCPHYTDDADMWCERVYNKGKMYFQGRPGLSDYRCNFGGEKVPGCPDEGCCETIVEQIFKCHTDNCNCNPAGRMEDCTENRLFNNLLGLKNKSGKEKNKDKKRQKRKKKLTKSKTRSDKKSNH